MMESKRRGVLDTPHARGMTDLIYRSLAQHHISDAGSALVSIEGSGSPVILASKPRKR
jgi:hypothetical protein